MKRVVIMLNTGSYSSYKANDIGLSDLAQFLSYDVGYRGGSNFKEWIFDSKYDETCSNATCLEKDLDTILIIDQMDLQGSQEEPHEPFGFRIRKKALWQVIDDWERLCKQKPKEIIITQDDDGKVTLTGNNEIIPDGALRFRDGRYRYSRSNDKYLTNLVSFFAHLFKKEGLSHNFIVNEWMDDTKQTKLYDQWLFIEKKDGLISILRNPGKADESSAFITTKEKLREIYQRFEEVKALKPKMIVITRENDEIKIEGAEW